jgi:hypothetical protein
MILTTFQTPMTINSGRITFDQVRAEETIDLYTQAIDLSVKYTIQELQSFLVSQYMHWGIDMFSRYLSHPTMYGNPMLWLQDTYPSFLAECVKFKGFNDVQSPKLYMSLAYLKYMRVAMMLPPDY